MKCLFLVLDSGASIRNILRTDVFKVLKAQEDLKIVIFSPIVDDEFRREFEAERVFIESIPSWKPNPLVKSLRSLSKDIWADQANIFTFQQKRKKKESRFVRNMLLRSFMIGLLRRMHSGLNVEVLLKKLERLEAACTPSLADYYFNTYRPDLVFYTAVYVKDPCLAIAAQQRSIPNVCFVHSWDNPTSKGPMPFKSQRFIVWNEILKQEVIQYHHVPADRIRISGVPQFDIYVDREKFRSRSDYFTQWGLDPQKRLLTYTTGTPGMIPFDHEVVELLYDALQRGAFLHSCQLLVRLHPKDEPHYYSRFEGKPGLVLQRPGRPAVTNDNWNPTVEDMYGLAELMHYSDVVVNVASTITIDAAAFDTPVVNVAFDGHEIKPYKESCRRYYDFEHYRNIVKTEGVRVAYSVDELIGAVNLYLDNPQLDAEGRARLREEQCWKLDGQSGKRIAEYVLECLNGKETLNFPDLMV